MNDCNRQLQEKRKASAVIRFFEISSDCFYSFGHTKKENEPHTANKSDCNKNNSLDGSSLCFVIRFSGSWMSTLLVLSMHVDRHNKGCNC